MEEKPHIDENILEEFAINSSSFSENKAAEIKLHLESCAFCRDIYSVFYKINTDLKNIPEKLPDENDKELAEKIVGKFGRTSARRLGSRGSQTITIHDGKVEISQKKKLIPVLNYFSVIRKHPVQSAGALILAGILFFLFMPTLKNSFNPPNPAFIELKSSKLIILDKNAEPLWELPAFGIPEERMEKLTQWVYGDKRYINVIDINNDGINEILISGKDIPNTKYSSDSVYCFSNKGNLLWVSGAEKPGNSDAPKWRRTQTKVRDFFATKYGREKKLFVVANDASYAGAFISELNPENGKVLSTIYHAGWLSASLCLDLDKDGNDEIILGGINTFNKAVIMILKTDRVDGVMPDYFSPGNNYKKGTAYAYVQLYCRDLSRIDHKFLSGYDITELGRFGENGFHTLTLEYSLDMQKDRSGVQYAFDNKINIIYISAGSEYSQKYDQLLNEGLVKEPLDSNYYKTLKDSVQYWDGDRFVNHFALNKHYRPQNK